MTYHTVADRTTMFEYVPPRWSTGHITSDDAAFLAALVGEFAPAAMLEVGVASGCSSAVLLHALAGLHGVPDGSAPWLYSFDIADRCYFDPSHRVGEAVDEIASALRPAWRLVVGDARAAGRLLRNRSLALAFIDADHRHPWPTLDLLAVLPALRPGAWVALHDVRLSELGTGPEYDARGAQYLFEAWPWARRLDRVHRNLGAVRLDGSPDEIALVCARVLEQPWEASVPRDTLAALGLARHDPAIGDPQSPPSVP